MGLNSIEDVVAYYDDNVAGILLYLESNPVLLSEYYTITRYHVADPSLPRVALKHQPGKHDQRTHTPKAYLGASSDAKALADPNSKVNQDAVKNWKNLSHEERMALADPEAINLRMGEQLDRYRKEYDAPHDLAGKELTAKSYSQVADNARAHIDSLHDALNPTTERMLHDYVDTYMQDAVTQSLKEGSLKIDAGELDTLMRRNIDKLTFQEIESRKRQLGDHGVRHVVGNMQSLHMMLNDTDLKPVSGMDKLMAMQTMVDHDMGYTAGISTKSFEATKYHELFSEQYAKSEGYDKLFGNRTAEMHNWVKTHAETGLDWQKQPVLSAIRTADNTALFAREKYPALFNDVPGANSELYKLQLAQVAGTAKEALPSVKSNLRNLVDKSDLDPRQKEDLHMAVEEVFPLSGKFTLGMGAGEIDGYDYTKDGIMHVKVTGKPEKEALDGVFDLGQRQFDKFVGNYEQEGTPSTGWKLKDASGNAVLQIDYKEAKAPVSGALGRLYGDSVRPDIKQASRMTGASSARSDRERIWPAIEANVKGKLTSSELAEFERRFKAGTLDKMPLTSKEKAFLTEEVVKTLKMLLGEEEALKHLPGRHDQKSHTPRAYASATYQIHGLGYVRDEDRQDYEAVDGRADIMYRSLVEEVIGPQSGPGAVPWNSDEGRGMVKHAVVSALADQTGLGYDRTNELIKTWAHTSNDHDPVSLGLQQAASDVFGVELSEWQTGKIKETVERYRQSDKAGDKLAVKQFDDSRRDSAKVLTAMYNMTQVELEAAGIKEITLYRGTSLPRSGEGIWPGAEVDISSNALGSWSLEYRVAEQFSDRHEYVGQDGVVFKMTVPAERIACMPFTGSGCLTEKEFIVLGRPNGAQGHDKALAVYVRPEDTYYEG